VLGAMRSIKDDLAACFLTSGVAQIRYDVQGATGRITLLHIDGPAATPGCVEHVFARLRFEPFRNEIFKVSFPFQVGPR
jgi:hypothetical protein